MAKERILFAHADPQVQEAFRRAFGLPWNVRVAGSGEEALTLLQLEPCDVLVADLDLPQIDGAELVNLVRETFPDTLRLILAHETDRTRVMTKVLGAHQFLCKPLETAALKSTVERTVALDKLLANDSIRELVSSIRTFPTIPSAYLKILGALRSPNVTPEEISEIIGQDMGMTTKLLHVTNSTCFGLSRQITEPAEAIALLGFETVKSMVLTIKLLNEYDHLKPIYFSINRLWRHSTEVARIAKQLVLQQTGDVTLAETAFTGGLLHDVGKAVLASNFNAKYPLAQTLAGSRRIPVWQAEAEIFGASHSEIGAYLLGLWGMPLEILEAAALHHRPLASIEKGFTPLTAVHIANTFEHDLNPQADSLVRSEIDREYLAELGILQNLNSWRETIAKGGQATPARSPASKPASRKLSAPPKASRSVATRRWFYFWPFARRNKLKCPV